LLVVPITSSVDHHHVFLLRLWGKRGFGGRQYEKKGEEEGGEK
jgi:hypothetical protein